MHVRPRHAFALVTPVGLLASIAMALTWMLFGTHIRAQAPRRAEFDAVSIKRVDEVRPSSGFRTLPDGSEVLSNVAVAGFVRQAFPVKVREVLGLPEPRFQDFKSRCGHAMSGTSTMSIVSGGMSMDQLALAMDGAVDADVENRTALQGWYALSLTYAPLAGGTQGDVPDVFTAVQEQLGLKLQREKKMMPVFEIDHIERPSEN
jgi:hypothetical protein